MANRVDIVVGVTNNTRPDLAAIKASLDELGKRVVNPRVDLNDLKAKAQLDSIRLRLQQLNDYVAGPKVDLAGLLRARLEIDRLKSSLNDLNKMGGGGWLSKIGGWLTKGFGGLGGGAAGGAGGIGGFLTMLLSAGPAGIGILAGLAAAAVALVLALAPVAAAIVPITIGFGALAALTGPLVINLFKTMTETGSKLKATMAALSPAERDVVRQMEPMKDQFDALRKAIQPQIIKAFGEGLKIIKSLMPAIKPLVEAAAKAVVVFLDNMADWLASPAGKSFVNWLRTVGPADIRNFGRIMWDTAHTVGDALHAIYSAGSWIDRLVTHWQDDWIIIKASARIALDWVALKFLGTVKTVIGFAADIPVPWQKAFQHMRDAIGAEMKGITTDVQNQSRLIGDAWAAIHGKKVPLTFDLNLPTGIGITGPGGQKTPKHAAGTAGAAPGLAWVGEAGPELVRFKGGESVYSAHMSRMIARGYAAGTIGPDFTEAIHPAAGVFARHLTSAAASIEASIARFVNAHAVLTGTITGTGGMGPGGPVEAVARALFPWPAAMWPSFNAVEMAEAGYNLTARNPKSGAYGVAQFINGPAEYYQWGGNPITAAGQFTGMFNYIRSRYVNPVNAWAHEQAFHWYGGGGPASGWVGVGEHGRELVRLPPGSQVHSAADSARMMSAIGGGTPNLVVSVDPRMLHGLTRELLKWLRFQVRTIGGGDVQAAFGSE